jgi:alpha-1,2-mannosyltransferase
MSWKALGGIFFVQNGGCSVRYMRPWRAFGSFGLPILYIWLLFGFTTLRSDLAMIADGSIGDDYHLIGRDFVNIWQGGKLAEAGEVERVYNREAYRASLEKTAGLKGIYTFSYPPHMLAMSVPFGRLSYLAALMTWTILTFGLFWHAARPWLADVALPSWSVFVLPGTVVNLWAGHFGFLIGALVLYGWRNAGNVPLKSGVAFAAMTVKPHLGVLVPLLLVAKKQWHVVVFSAVLSVLFFIISAALFGIDAWMIWLKSTLPYQSSLIGTHESGMGFLLMMPTVERLASALGLNTGSGFVMQFSFALAALGLLGHAWHQGVEIRELGLLSILATFLVLPYVFNYDMVAFDIVILVMTARYAGVLSLAERWILAAAFLIPVIQVALAQSGLPIAPVVILSSLFILVRHCAKRAKDCA